MTRPLDQSAGEESAYAVYDRLMADAVARLTDDHPMTANVMVWAHNGHLAKDTYGDRIIALGSRLSQRYGDRDYGLALLFGRGSFHAQGRRFESQPVRHRIGGGRRSVEARFANAMKGDYSVDLRSTTALWLHAPQAQRSFGANVPRFAYRVHTAPLVPAKEYYGIASLPARPAPTRCRRSRNEGGS
ncbi:erythromycin esterase family protein [Streptomyces californicus]|uniref:erythromycin esterase family protein n=1 Tax=Streptomyces TaxID=1883 RepID=UPI0036BFD9B9